MRFLTLAIVAALPLGAQQIDSTRALGALRDARSACVADAGALWGTTLCGPIAMVDRQTRLVLANDTVAGAHHLPYGDAYVTTLPAGRFIANTSFSWGNREWTMLALPLPADRYSRVALVMHEVFHREQAALGLRQNDALNNHLDFRDGRRWLRLEYRALAAALDAPTPAERIRHARNAALFRAQRHALYPGADSLEATLEMQEGLPEYTGHHLAMQMTGAGVDRVARHVREWDATRVTYVRGFAYGTGPALGVLLDSLAPTWRTKVKTQRSPGTLLAQALAFRAPRNLAAAARASAGEYGADDVDRQEAARDSARAPAMRDYRARFVDGPTITLTQTRDSLNWGFDPNSLIAFDLTHAIYPFGNFSAPWGSLNVTANGVLVRNDLTMLRAGIGSATIDPSARELKGDGWTLTLNPGWRLRPDPAKPGSHLATTLGR